MVIRYGESLWLGKPKPGEGVMVGRINPTGGGWVGKRFDAQNTAQGLKWSDKEWYKTIYYIQNP